MFDGAPYRDELGRRIETMRRMLDVSDPPLHGGGDISREVRGLIVVLLFASYENLLSSLCRGVLERAVSLRVGNRRLRTGFRQFAVHSLLVSISGSGENKIWKESGRNLLECAFDSRNCTVNTNIFPKDGSFMKRTQVSLFCSIFEIGDPGSILKEVWARLDTVVTERNNIAHGMLTPEEVGRGYTREEIRILIESWERRWVDFIDVLEERASRREFYRI